ncbi:MAG TPA: IS4 family transposase [Rhizobium sp.]|nr:IS4 family transposase [Rhizobium sp.]
MTALPSIDLRGTLLKLFPDALLRQWSKSTGAVKRLRKVDPVDFFWTLVLGFGVERDRTLAALRRRFILATGQDLEESAFQGRFTREWVKVLKRAAAQALEVSFGPARALRGHLQVFKDVLMSDATVIRLHQLLESAYPGCRTNSARAAAKVHLIMNVTGASKQAIRITAERRHENHVLRVGKWIESRLMLFDLGYYDFKLFARIDQHGGYFLSRLKSNANPTLTDIHRVDEALGGDALGMTLAEVVERLKGDTLDAQVSLSFRKRVYNGKKSKNTLSVRLVGRRNSATGEFHLYLTNVPPHMLAPEDVQATYSLRWGVELLFKELKTHYRLEQMPSSRQEVVEALLYTAIISLAVGRRLLQRLRQAMPEHAERFKSQRFAALMATVADLLLIIVRNPGSVSRFLQQRVCHILCIDGPDPNKFRLALLAAAENKALPCSVAA